MDQECILCAHDFKYIGIAPCDHKFICINCIYKWRVFQKNNQCPICKASHQYFIVTDQYNVPYEKLQSKAIIQSGNILFTSKEAEQAIKNLEALKCQVKFCESNENFKNLSILKNHIGEQHGLYYCDICLQFRTCSLSEQILYTKQELDQHFQYGDLNDKQEPLFFHPYCKFCSKKFYDEDYMLTHLKQSHEKCHLCTENLYTYFEGYKNLERHFKKTHYICPVQSCIDKQFVVFKTQNDLDLHRLTVHEKETKISNQMLTQFTGFYDRQEETKQPVQLRFKDKEGVDFSNQLNSVSKNKNKGFKKNNDNNRSDMIDLIDIFGIDFSFQQDQNQHQQLYQKKQEQNTQIYLNDIKLYRNLPLFTYEQFTNRLYQFLNKSQVFQLQNEITSYYQVKLTPDNLIKSFTNICGVQNGSSLFQFFYHSVQDQQSYFSLHISFLKYLLGIPQRQENPLFAKCLSYLDLLKRIDSNISSEIVQRIQQKQLINNNFIDKQRVDQFRSILNNLSNQDKFRMKFAANFAIRHQSIQQVMDQIIMKNNFKDIETDQLLMIFIYFKIGTGYEYSKLEKGKYNILEPLILENKNIFKIPTETPQVSSQNQKLQNLKEKEQIQEQIQQQSSIPNEEKQKQETVLISKKKHENLYEIKEIKQQSDDETKLEDYGCWETDQVKKEKVIAKKQELGRVKKGKQQIVFLKGGFK